MTSAFLKSWFQSWLYSLPLNVIYVHTKHYSFTCMLVSIVLPLVQLEIDDGDELTEDFLYDEVHPKQHAHTQAFAKPCGPAGKRGHKRLIKGTGGTLQNS